MSRFLYPLTFLVLLGVVVYFFTVLFPQLRENYPTETFDARTKGYKPSEAAGILKQFEDAGQLDNYLEQEWKYDLIFPLIYGAMLMIPIIGLAPKLGAPRWLILLPILAMIGDWIENLSVIGMILRYREQHMVPYPLALTASIASRIKTWCLLASIIVAAALGVWWVVHWLRRR
jgi:hypothetical protein